MVGTRMSEIVISHWYKLIEGLEASPLAFYTAVEAAIEKRQIPGAERSRVDWKEGGIVSAKREYLRVTRQEHIIDICGAPFGTGFFFSSWLAEMPAEITLLDILILLFWVGLVGFGFIRAFGILLGLILFLVTSIALFLIARLHLIPISADLDASLRKIPVVGPFYERFFRPYTYYRIDTALMFQQAVHAALLEVIDGLTSAKGLRALSDDERKPILRDFYRR